MTIQEFEKLVKEVVHPEDYEKIEFVYTYHPMLDDIDDPKATLAELYRIGGMMIISDMTPTAQKARDLYKSKCKVQAQIYELQQQIDELDNQQKNLLIEKRNIL